jgi:hypothetical protein
MQQYYQKYREKLFEVNFHFLLLVNVLVKVFVQSSEVPRTTVVCLNGFFKLVTVFNGITKSLFNEVPPVEKILRSCHDLVNGILKKMTI